MSSSTKGKTDTKEAECKTKEIHSYRHGRNRMQNCPLHDWSILHHTSKKELHPFLPYNHYSNIYLIKLNNIRRRWRKKWVADPKNWLWWIKKDDDWEGRWPRHLEWIEKNGCDDD